MEFAAEIISIREETRDVKTFRIKRPFEFGFKPGEYCLVSFVDKPEFGGESRPFTFSSSPTEKEFIELTIKEMGEFTRALFSLKERDKLKIDGPKETKLSFDESIKENIVFLTGGSGITPFISSIRYSLSKRLPNKILLFYSNRTEKDIIYRKELESINSSSIKVINTLSDEVPDYWDGEKGRINREMIEKYVTNPSEFLWYICGPPPMVKAMKSILTEINVPEDKLRIEDWQIPGKGR